MSARLRAVGGIAAIMVVGAALAGLGLHFLLVNSAPPALVDPTIAERSAKAAATGTLPVGALDPDAEARAVFAHHHTLDLDGGKLVTGVVRNTSLTIVSRPDITVICEDEAGKELARATAGAEREVLLPNGTSPVKVPLPGVSRCPSPRFEVAVEKPDAVAVYARDLLVESDPPVKDATGAWEFSGRVNNKGDRIARYVQIQIQAWDVSGRLVGVDEVFAKGDMLPLGGQARFRLSGVRYGKEPAKFEFTAFGRSAY